MIYIKRAVAGRGATRAQLGSARGPGRGVTEGTTWEAAVYATGEWRLH